MKVLVYFIFALLVIPASYSQVNADNTCIKVLFYNVENLFDTIDDKSTNDNEFTPEGIKNWNSYRYWKKINQLFQVIAFAGEETPPQIIGLCEVEDFRPLYHIINNTPLLKYPYQIVHFNSPDKRGIDVGLLIRKDVVKLISCKPLNVALGQEGDVATRDILYASLLIGSDTLHTFVNHWPSRRGGQAKSEPKRMKAAYTLKAITDSLLNKDDESKILVMGDFNDEPQDNSLRVLEETSLINLSGLLQDQCNCGTYKYRNNWNMIDQFLVSGGIAGEDEHCSKVTLNIIRQDFLLVEDQTYGGQKPFRTFAGPNYLGGYSDHLPIMLEITME